jgi:glycosyltransferase involved in cell wall biosynthesis
LGAYGLFAIRGDVDSLAEQLEQALFNDDRRPEIGRQLHQRAVQQFDWTPTGRDILQAYADLLGDEAPAASAKPISQIPKQSV